MTTEQASHKDERKGTKHKKENTRTRIETQKMFFFWWRRRAHCREL